MSSSQRFFVACLLLLAAGSFSAWAGPQAAKPAAASTDQEQFVDIVNVSVVNVDVYVTDKKGQPVTGLSREDFQIFENNRPVEITNFFAVNEGKPATPPEEEETRTAAAPASSSPAPAPQEPETVQMPAEQRLSLIVYIDNFNLRPFNRNRVMGELRAFIGQKLSKGDQLMLVTYDRELHVRRNFTSDPSLIAAAMVDLSKISAQGVHADSERRDTLQRIEDSETVAQAESAARTYAQSTYNDLSFSIDALKKMIDALAGMPGRKAVLYVSDGLQMIAGQDVFYAVQNKYSEQSTSLTQTLEFDASRRFTELTAQANANRITFYTIDAAGLRVYESNSAENRGPGPTAPGFTQMVDSVRIQNLQSPLQMMGCSLVNPLTCSS